MKTLDEHNEDVLKRLKIATDMGTGVACPQCKEELIYTNDHILTSNPPKRRVHCSHCFYAGYKL